MRPTPRSHGHRVGPPVFASWAAGTETAAEAPAAVVGVVVADVAAVAAVVPPLALVGFTKNGAEKRCGLLKSS